MTSPFERLRRWVRRDRDEFWSQARAVPWTTWFLGQGVFWAAGLAVLGLLAAAGRPSWNLLAALIAITGGQGLTRLHARWAVELTRFGWTP